VITASSVENLMGLVLLLLLVAGANPCDWWETLIFGFQSGKLL
jgi:hypothetical protein